MQDIENLCDIVILMDDGRIIYDVDIHSLKNKFGNIKTINYRFNTFTWLLISVFQIFCIIFLWIGVYSSSLLGGDSVINGFTSRK